MHVVCESAVADRSPTAFEAVSLDAEDPRPLTTESRRTNSELGRNVYLGTVIAAGTVVLLSSAVETISRPPGTLWLVLAGLTAVSSGAMVRLPGFPASFSLGDTFSILSALLFGVGSAARDAGRLHPIVAAQDIEGDAGAPRLQCDRAGGGDVDLSAPVFRGRPRAAACGPALVDGTDHRPARRVWRIVFPVQQRPGGRRRHDRSADFAVPIVARTLFPCVGDLLRRDLAGCSDFAADVGGCGESGHAHAGAALDSPAAHRHFHGRRTAAGAKRPVRQAAILRGGAAQHDRRGTADRCRRARDVHQSSGRTPDRMDGRAGGRPHGG